MQGVLLVIEILFIMFLLAKQAISILLWFMSIIMFQMSFETGNERIYLEIIEDYPIQDCVKPKRFKFIKQSFNRFLIISLDVLICRYSPLFRAFPALFISEEPHKSFYYPLCFRSQK